MKFKALVYTYGLFCSVTVFGITHLIPKHLTSFPIPFEDANTLFFWNQSPAVLNTQNGNIYVLTPSKDTFQTLKLPIPIKLLEQLVDISEFGQNLALITKEEFIIISKGGQFIKRMEVSPGAQLRKIRCFASACYMISTLQQKVWVYDKRLKYVSELILSGDISFETPFGLTQIPRLDTLFVSNIFPSTIIRKMGKHSKPKTFGGWGIWEGSLYFPKGIDWDLRHNFLWVADSFLKVVQAFDKKGNFVGVLANKEDIQYFNHPFLVRSNHDTLSILSLFPPTLYVYDTKPFKRVKRKYPFSEKYHIRFNYITHRAPTEEPKPAGCIHCHDTSIRDSRFVWSGMFHPEDVVDSKTGKIPEHIPKGILISDKQLIQCGTCHVPHHIEVLDAEQTELGVSRQIRLQEAVASVNFLRFHKKSLCIKCHEEKLKETKHHVDSKSDKKGLQCFDCHDVHRGEDKHLTVLNTKQSVLCISCHEETHHKGHPVRSGGVTNEDIPICSECHGMHIDHTMLLTQKDRKPGSNCLECHEEMEPLLDSVHYFQNSKFGSACLSCHSAHKPTNDMYDLVALSIKRDRKTIYPTPKVNVIVSTKKFCVACHQNDRMDDHEPISLTDQTGLDIKSLQTYLFNKRGEDITPDRVGYITCRTCHNVHQPCDAHECKDDPKKGRFLRNPTKVIKICSACHAEESLVKFRYFHRKQSRETKTVRGL